MASSRTSINTNSEHIKYVNGYQLGSDAQQPFIHASLTGQLSSTVIRITDKTELSLYPIIMYATGLKQRSEYVRAIIRNVHKNGQNTNQNKPLRDETIAKGLKGDQSGHIIANSLGGPMKNYNLFPQNPSLNRGFYSHEYEAKLRAWVQNGGKDANVDFQVRLLYPTDTTTDNPTIKPTRPDKLLYLIRYMKGDRLATTTELFNATHSVVEQIDFGDIPNPPPNETYSLERSGGEDYKVIRK